MNEHDSVRVYNHINNEYNAASGLQVMAANPYRPWPARITSITPLTPNESLFEFRFLDPQIREAFDFESGQFIELSIFGVGEAPISISSAPSKRGFIELCVRRAGSVTRALHNKQCGDIVGLRGPFGVGFPFEEMKGHDALLVAGGLGIAPLKSLINHIHDERADFGNVTIMYGARSPELLMFRSQFNMWKNRNDFNLILCINKENDSPDWDGYLGYVTDHFDKVDVDPAHTFGVIVGPPGMYGSVIEKMREIGLHTDRIYVDLERNMRCGIGKCGHCMIGHQYVCTDGPVFNYWDAVNMQGAM